MVACSRSQNGLQYLVSNFYLISPLGCLKSISNLGLILITLGPLRMSAIRGSSASRQVYGWKGLMYSRLTPKVGNHECPGRNQNLLVQSFFLVMRKLNPNRIKRIHLDFVLDPSHLSRHSLLSMLAFLLQPGPPLWAPDLMLWAECLCRPKSSCWNLIPETIVLGGGVFRRWLVHEGGALRDGISALIKEAWGKLFAPSTLWRYRRLCLRIRKGVFTRHWICPCLDLEFPSLYNEKK